MDFSRSPLFEEPSTVPSLDFGLLQDFEDGPLDFEFQDQDLGSFLASGIDDFCDHFDQSAADFDTSSCGSSTDDEDTENAAPSFTVQSRYSSLLSKIPSLEEPKPVPTTTPVIERPERSTRSADTDTPLVIPEEGGDLFMHLMAMPMDSYVVPKLTNVEARRARLNRRQVINEQRVWRQLHGQTRTHYEERSIRAQTRKRKGGKFESEGKKPFVAVTQLR